jgi:hypothetical protein
MTALTDSPAPALNFVDRAAAHAQPSRLDSCTSLSICRPSTTSEGPLAAPPSSAGEVQQAAAGLDNHGVDFIGRDQAPRFFDTRLALTCRDRGDRRGDARQFGGLEQRRCSGQREGTSVSSMGVESYPSQARRRTNSSSTLVGERNETAVEVDEWLEHDQPTPHEETLKEFGPIMGAWDAHHAWRSAATPTAWPSPITARLHWRMVWTTDTGSAPQFRLSVKL